MNISIFLVFFCKQKTAYEMRISDWSSDVCSSDLLDVRWRMGLQRVPRRVAEAEGRSRAGRECRSGDNPLSDSGDLPAAHSHARRREIGRASCRERVCQYVQISVVGVSLKTKKSQYKLQVTYDIIR